MARIGKDAKEPARNPAKTKALNHSVRRSLAKTLSNEYIDRVIASHRQQFVKCQSHAVREKKPAMGRILVGLSIAPRGRLSEVKILASDIDNSALHRCLASVFQRTRFKSFQGPEIVRSYPLVFE